MLIPPCFSFNEVNNAKLHEFNNATGLNLSLDQFSDVCKIYKRIPVTIPVLFELFKEAHETDIKTGTHIVTVILKLIDSYEVALAAGDNTKQDKSTQLNDFVNTVMSFLAGKAKQTEVENNMMTILGHREYLRKKLQNGYDLTDDDRTDLLEFLK